jgi:hypothetical protein
VLGPVDSIDPIGRAVRAPGLVPIAKLALTWDRATVLAMGLT